MPKIAPTAVYIDWPRLAPSPPVANDPDRDSLLAVVSAAARSHAEVNEGEWESRYRHLLGYWHTPMKGLPDLEALTPGGGGLPSTLLVTGGDVGRLEVIRKAVGVLVEWAADEAYVADARNWEALTRGFVSDAPFALAYLVLTAKLRRAVTRVVEAAAEAGERTLGEVVNAAFLTEAGAASGISPGSLLLYLLPRPTDKTPGVPAAKGKSDLCVAAEHVDRVDERTFRAVVVLLESGGRDAVATTDAGGEGPAGRRASHTALSEVGHSDLGRWLRKYPRIDPLNTFDSALAGGRPDDVIRSCFESILGSGGGGPRDPDEGCGKVKYLLSLASGVADYVIEGRPAYFTLLVTADGLDEDHLDHMTEIFRYTPGLPIQYRNKPLRSAIESSPSPNFVLCASLHTMRVERCLSYRSRPANDVYRRNQFAFVARQQKGVIIHTHQSGSVEVYNKKGLCLLGHGIEWFENPYQQLWTCCRSFFETSRPNDFEEVAWRVCGVVANLVEQRASSIMLFTRSNTIEALESRGILTSMQEAGLNQSALLCVKDRFYFDDVCRFLRIDGAHAVSDTGGVIRFGMKIRDAESDRRVGGTGTSATATIARELHTTEIKMGNPKSTSFVVQVSGSGYYSLYQYGRQVPTPFDE